MAGLTVKRSASRVCSSCSAFCPVEGHAEIGECRSGPPSTEGWATVPRSAWCEEWEAADPIAGTFGGLLEGLGVWLEEAPTAGVRWGKRQGAAVPPSPDPLWLQVATFKPDKGSPVIEFWAKERELWCVAEHGGAMIGVELSGELEEGGDDGQGQADS